MGVSELTVTLEQLARSNAVSADPQVRVVLSSLVPHSRELLRTQCGSATSHFRALSRSLMRLSGVGNAELRLGLLYDCCHHFYLSGFPSESVGPAEHGVWLSKRTGRIADHRRFLNILGVVSAEIGDRGRGLEMHAMALAVSRSLDDHVGQYVAWSNLSAVLVDSGLYDEAIACARRALELIAGNQADADNQRARALTNTSLAFLLLGNNLEAERLAMEAIRVSSEPDSHSTAVVRLVRELNLVMALAENRKYSLARERVRYMRAVAGRFPSRRTEGTSQLCEGLIEVYLGDAQRGIAMVEEVANKLRGTMIPLYVDSLSLLVKIYRDLDRPEDALKTIRELLVQATSISSEQLRLQLEVHGEYGANLASCTSQNLREHARTEADLRARVAEREVLRSRQEMLERMAVAADIREDISGEHGYRVGRLSALLAREIGWERDACNALDIAARLHDIGKIGIPEKILLDEKTLRAAEKHFIASHTLVGAEILARSEIPQVRIAEEVARCHHEWWDGTGYPRQLKGLDIPKSARIVALADAFDAMTHGRPYAKAITVEAALDQIAGLRARQFDPELTDHFLALVRRLAATNEDLDAYLGKAARNSPFLRARARIKELLAQGRDSTALSATPPPPGTPLN